jgi:hypothetical protein
VVTIDLGNPVRSAHAKAARLSAAAACGARPMIVMAGKMSTEVKSSPPPDGAEPAGLDAGGRRATLLDRAVQSLRPLVRLLLHHGIDHPRLASALKRVFVEAALEELARRGTPPDAATHTAVSLLTGLQRRDVKSLRDGDTARWPAKAFAPTLPMQAVARWATQPALQDAQGPLPLPLRASRPGQPCFEALADSLTKDVHPPALLDELLRLGLVEAAGDGLYRLTGDRFPAAQDQDRMAAALLRNGHDHLAAGVHNLLDGGRPFLEYALTADELRPASAEALHQFARRWWADGYAKAVRLAAERIEIDKAAGFDARQPEMRVRWGVYFYSEPVAPAATHPPDAAAPTRARRRATPNPEEHPR